jgi:hypothetical protein
MADRYIYYFMARDAATGDTRLSPRPATLAAIAGRGEPVMESQLVVDHTELDDNGFFVAGSGGDARAAEDISAQIRSAELRAASRDSEALSMNDGAEGRDKYMLTLESRELRGQARRLKLERADSPADEPANRNDRPDCVTRNCHA